MSSVAQREKLWRDAYYTVDCAIMDGCPQRVGLRALGWFDAYTAEEYNAAVKRLFESWTKDVI